MRCCTPGCRPVGNVQLWLNAVSGVRLCVAAALCSLCGSVTADVYNGVSVDGGGGGRAVKSVTAELVHRQLLIEAPCTRALFPQQGNIHRCLLLFPCRCVSGTPASCPASLRLAVGLRLPRVFCCAYRCVTCSTGPLTYPWLEG